MVELMDLLKQIPQVSDEEAEKADYLICMPVGPSPFNDNFTGNCSKCGIEVMYRWHAPRRPPKLCWDCFVKLESKEIKQSQESHDEQKSV